MEREKPRSQQRKRIIGVVATGGALVLGAAALASQMLNRDSQTDDCPIPPPASDVKGLNNIEAVQRVIENIHFSRNQRADERELWGIIEESDYPLEIPQSLEERIPYIQTAVDDTIYAMGQSENPCFRGAHDFIENLERKKRLAFIIGPLGGSFAETGLFEENGEAIWALTFNSNGTLLERSPVVLALVITHEVDHIRNGNEYWKANPHLSPEQFIDEYEALNLDPQKALEEESRGYAQGARAFVYAQALLRYPASSDLIFLRDAANLIRCERDETSNCWISYLESEGNRIMLHE